MRCKVHSQSHDPSEAQGDDLGLVGVSVRLLKDGVNPVIA